jgi:hypothetical protein
MRPALNIRTQLSLLFDRFGAAPPRTRPTARHGAELHIGDFHPSVQERLLGLFAADGAQALMDACNVIQVLESLHCGAFTMPRSDTGDLLVIDLQRANGEPVRVAVARPAWSLGRATLARLLQPQLGTGDTTDPAARAEVHAAAPIHHPCDGELTLSGDCAQIALTDLLQMLVRNGRTGVVRLALEGGPFGECCLTDGELTHARCHGYLGEEALVELLGVRGATFTFTRERAAQRTIYRKATAVIMDTVRLLDEREQEGRKAG